MRSLSVGRCANGSGSHTPLEFMGNVEIDNNNGKKESLECFFFFPFGLFSQINVNAVNV